MAKLPIMIKGSYAGSCLLPDTLTYKNMTGNQVTAQLVNIITM